MAHVHENGAVQSQVGHPLTIALMHACMHACMHAQWQVAPHSERAAIRSEAHRQCDVRLHVCGILRAHAMRRAGRCHRAGALGAAAVFKTLAHASYWCAYLFARVALRVLGLYRDNMQVARRFSRLSWRVTMVKCESSSELSILTFPCLRALWRVCEREEQIVQTGTVCGASGCVQKGACD